MPRLPDQESEFSLLFDAILADDAANRAHRDTLWERVLAKFELAMQVDEDAPSEKHARKIGRKLM